MAKQPSLQVKGAFKATMPVEGNLPPDSPPRWELNEQHPPSVTPRVSLGGLRLFPKLASASHMSGNPPSG